MIKHVLKSGREVESVRGTVINPIEFKSVYSIAEKQKERGANNAGPGCLRRIATRMYFIS